MSHAQDASNRLGELFLTGVQGHELSDDSAAFLSQAGIGGVILFSHNYKDPEQLARLVQQIQDCRGELPFWISVDQEGGRVQRFKEGFTRLPNAKAIGALDSPKQTFEISQMAGLELKAVGINLNFAPIADILTEPKNEVIGDRSFGTIEDHVTKMVTASVRGLLTAGVQACVKHFPGHGSTIIDSHEDLPRVSTDLATLQAREFRPFTKTFRSRCNFVMIGHLLMEKLDSDFPASLSKKILQDLLRTEMRYTKIIVSDDMEMKAITNQYGEKEAPILAIEAGCDLLIYRSENMARKAYESARRALEDGKLSTQRVFDSSESLRQLKAETLQPFEPVNLSEIKSKVGTPENLQLVENLLK